MLENSESNKASFKRILNKDAENIEDIAFYFHLQPSLSSRFKTDLMTTIMKFKKFSPVLSVANAELFLNKLAIDSKLKSSTIAKYARNLQIYFKECCLKDYRDIQCFNTISKILADKLKFSDVTTSIISRAYMKLQNSELEEEALFLYLTFSLCLPPRRLWFLTFDSVSENNILTI